MGKIAKNVPDSVKQRNPKNKKSKSVLIFDEKAREDYLTGFSKRKQERRKVAQEKIIEDLKEQKRQLKLQKRKELNEKWEKLNLKLDFDHIVEPKVYDLEEQTVTITDISGVDIGSSTGLKLGINQISSNDSESEDVDKIKDRKRNKDDSENSSDDNSDKDEEENPKKKDKSKKKKHKGKPHKNLTHLMSKQNQAKARKKKKIASKIPAHLRERGTGSRKKKKPRNPKG